MDRIQPPTGRRVLLFSHDTFGLGHLRRQSLVAHALARRLDDLSILHLSGSPIPHRFRIPDCADLVMLPSLTKDVLGRYAPRTLDVSTALLLSVRRGLVLETVRRFAPHLLLVDHGPLGAGGELAPALAWLRRHRPGTRIVLGLRDVVDAPRRVESEFGPGGLDRIVRRWYDEVLVYGDRRVLCPIREYGLSAASAAKVRFVGYVAPRIPRRPPRDPEAPLRILLHTGGGADGADAYRVALEGLTSTDEPFEAVVAVGPFATREARRTVRRFAERDRRLRVIRSRTDVVDLLASSDLVIQMAGANSVAETLEAAIPMILLPRRAPRKEQALRAERLERLGLARVLDPSDPDAPARLARWLRLARAGRLLPAARPRLETDGAWRTAERVAELLAGSDGGTSRSVGGGDVD